MEVSVPDNTERALLPLKQHISLLPGSLAHTLLERLRQCIHYAPAIGMMGKIGAGKSSLCNTLFAAPASAVHACTRQVQRYPFTLASQALFIVDFPGIGESPTEEALKRIGELYAVEEEIRSLPATERLAARQSRSKSLLASLHEWLVEKNATLSKKSRLGEAFTYALNQWDALCYYCDDGLAEAGRVEMWRGGFSPGISVNPPLSIGGALLS